MTELNYQRDIDAVSSLAPVPTILDMVCRTTGMGFAAIARVTADRWIACGVKDDIEFGLKPGGELEVETTICHEIRQSGEPVIINHVAEHPHFRSHKTPQMYGFQSYISMPIVLRDGSFFGTLCAIDPLPRKLETPDVIDMFRLFADLIAQHLSAQSRVEAMEKLLSNELQASELREQFIAVLGHDLRNPLSAISSGMQLLQRNPTPDRAAQVTAMVHQSITRMSGLISNLLDFARGRLGGGISLIRDKSDLAVSIMQVVNELRIGHPDQVVVAEIDLPTAINCDAQRVEQLLSNLLGNAFTHGSATEPIYVRASMHASSFELSVSNSGAQIPTEKLDKLFQPFARGENASGVDGLGLGLYIACDIAKAHGGVLEVESSPSETRFTFLMPLI